MAFPENTKVPARDLALAYYDLVLGGNDSLRGKAWEQLLAVHRAEQPDLAVANSLAYLAQKRGDDTQAAAFYGEALDIDPLNVNAANNLAILLARAGQLTPAERLWQAVFERNEDLDQPGFNLAIAECMLGKRESAEAVLERVLLYSPDQRRARRKLAAIRSGEETCNAPPQPGTR